MSQDGGATNVVIGLAGVADEDPAGNELNDTSANDLIIHHLEDEGIQFGVDNNLKAEFKSTFNQFFQDTYFTDDVGIGTISPGAKLHVIGAVTATSFIGDGSQLSGIASFISKYNAGSFNGSLYTINSDPALSDSNSIFQVLGSDGTPRFQIQDGGDEQASFIARSFMVVNQNNTRLNQSQNNLCSEWGFSYIDCNTSTTGADFGVQDDFEVQGVVYTKQGIYSGTSDWGVYALFGNLSRFSSGSNGSFYASHDYFCDFILNPFTQEQVDSENWIKIISGDYEGAIAQFYAFVNSSCVMLVHNPAWDSDLSNIKYALINEPQVVFNDGGAFHFRVGDNNKAKFEIDIKNGTDLEGVLVQGNAGVDQHKVFSLQTDANGFNGVSAFLSKVFSTSAVESTDTSNLLLEFIPINFNNSEHHFIDARISGEKASEMEVDLFSLNGDFNSYIKQGESESISKVYYDNALGSTVDITSSAVSSSSNVTIFENDNSILYIGGITNFSEIVIALETPSSADIDGIFYYCNDSGEWEEFLGGVSDTTSGLTSSGSIHADSPSDRGTCNKEIDGTPFADTNNYTYIALKRERNNIVTAPVELIISVGGGVNTFILTDDYIKLNGVSSPPVICESSVDGAI